METPLNRRDFLRTGAAAAAGLMLAQAPSFAASKSPNEKLNIAIIGCGHRATQVAGDIASENIVALCDPYENNPQTLSLVQRWPKATRYTDWRKCLEQKDIDAVVVTPPDHIHAFVNIWAMNRGLHVYSEKPLGNSVQEARLVRETYLKNKGKIATQMGVQRHTIPNMARVAELIKDGAIGTPLEAHVWCGRRPRGGGYPTPGPTPAGMNWDLWCGPSKFVPFAPEYISSDCLGWNRFWTFGTGQIGDMGSHDMDVPWWALDLELPTSCECTGTPYEEATVPYSIMATWEHPANSWRPAVKVTYRDGGKVPPMPTNVIDASKVGGDRTLFVGDKGYLLTDFNTHILFPKSNNDMTQYKARTAETLLPVARNHHQEWIKACKTDLKTHCDFVYSGNMIEHNMLSLVSYRVGKKIDYDPKTGKVTNAPEAEQYINHTYRPGYTLNG